MADNQNYDKYQQDYSESKFWKKLMKVARGAGVKLVYAALLLYYVLKNPATSGEDRAKIIGALGYFIIPFDLIPDFIPVAGYTDDLAALIWGIYSVSKNVTPEVKLQAKEKLDMWFKDYNESDLDGVI